MAQTIGSANKTAEHPDQQPGLSQIERVVDTYVAPSKTFADIRRSASWWLPFLLSAIVSVAFAYAIDRGIGYDKVAEANITRSPQAQERMSNLTDAQRAQTMHTIAASTRIFTYLSPVFTLGFAVIVAGILLVSFNFGLGAQATFGQYFAVWLYASLPMLIKFLLATITIFAGINTDQFDMRNPVGTNIGFYLSSDLPSWLRTLFSSADIFTIWTVVVLILGCSLVARVKRGSAAFIVIGWWLLVILGFTVTAAFQG